MLDASMQLVKLSLWLVNQWESSKRQVVKWCYATQHKDSFYAECHGAICNAKIRKIECRYCECRGATNVATINIIITNAD